MSALVAGWLVLAATGAGAAILRVLRLASTLDIGERLALAFAAGFGALGWLLFILGVTGLFDPVSLSLALVIASSGVLLVGRPGLRVGFPRVDSVGVALFGLLAIVLALDLFEGLSPPADADTLAYHFALPKQFLHEGQIIFVPRAVDGAVPLLVQMTYLPALALGGERSLTLWVMASGWAPAMLLFFMCRRFLSVNWSLAVALFFLTTPAVLYGAGTGQAEVRLALFALAAAWGAMHALRTNMLSSAALAGMAAGFYAGGKYFGLMFGASVAVVLLWHRNRWLAGSIFSVAFVLAGGQWYLWNWINTGDPLFPLLFDVIGNGDTGIWNAVHHRRFLDEYIKQESGVERSIYWLMVYPIAVTLFPIDAFDAGRVGIGPLPILIFPLAVGGLAIVWRERTIKPLLALVGIALAFYVLWFFFGSSQRVRHLLPIYPLALICMVVLAVYVAKSPARSRPLAAAVVFTLAVQSSGQLLASAKYVRHILSNESRDEFLSHNVNGYAVVSWVNTHLRSDQRVLLVDRQLIYLINIPVFYAHELLQTEISLQETGIDLSSAVSRLRRLRITHLVDAGRLEGGKVESASTLTMALVQAGCATVRAELPVAVLTSRTVPALGSEQYTRVVLEIDYDHCVAL